MNDEYSDRLSAVRNTKHMHVRVRTHQATWRQDFKHYLNLMLNGPTSTPQLPVKTPQVPSNRGQNALNRGALLKATPQDSWPPKVCETMACWAVFSGFGLFCYILLGSRYPKYWPLDPLCWDKGHISGILVKVEQASRSVAAHDLLLPHFTRCLLASLVVPGWDRRPLPLITHNHHVCRFLL